MIRKGPIFFCCIFALRILAGQALYDPPRLIGGVAVPEDFPAFTPSIPGETAPGYIFINNWEGSPYVMIFRNDGTPHFYQRVPTRARDFKVQPTGVLSRRSIEEGGFIVLDKHFRNIDTLRCQNGFGTDEHGLQLLPGGLAMMIALEYRKMDLSAYSGGNPNATVIGNHVQIIDSTDKVVFEWQCWDHFKLEDSYVFDPGDNTIDYVHMNSTAVDYDGHILMSSRHLSECTKIDRNTGEVIWRFGGKNNQFTFVNDEDGISFQHDFRPVPGVPGNYTLFDNGNQKEPGYSRAVEFHLDTATMLATRVWEYRHTPDRYSRWMGNVQRLPNGNTLINWADNPLPKATEVTPEGKVVYEADFMHNTPVYRTFRFEWDGYMLEPYLEAESYPDMVRLLFNKFGDEDVDYYKVYAGTDPGQMHWVDSTSATWLDLYDLEDSTHYYIEVTAVNTGGEESPPSRQAYVYSRKSDPGDNLILNADFSMDLRFWNRVEGGGASYESQFNGSTHKFVIREGGTQPWHIQLFQSGIPLLQGREYLLSMEAKADAPRTVEIKMNMNGPPWTNYSRTGFYYLTPSYQELEIPFVMQDPSDLDARLEINGGMSDIDFFVRDMTLRERGQDPSRMDDPFSRGTSWNIFPNPAHDQVFIQVEERGIRDLWVGIMDLSGRSISGPIPLGKGTGTGSFSIPLHGLPPGTYFVHLRGHAFSAWKKLVVVL
jgi:hypothetical protein